MTQNRIRLWLLGSVVLAITISPFLAQGNHESNQVIQQRLNEIAQLAPSERDRLERNWTAYQQMTPEQRLQVQQFHDQLEQDRRERQGELAKLTADYSAWLNTIEPYQRDQLNAMTDPDKRLQRIREIVTEQRERSLARSIPRSSMIPGRPGEDPPAHWLHRIPALGSDELARIMQEVERPPSRLTLAQKSELEQLEGIDRYVQLLQFLQDTDSKHQPLAVDPPTEFRRLLDGRFNDIVEDSRAREFVNDANSRMPPDHRLSVLLWKTLTIELLRQRHRGAKQPSQEELEAFFRTLPDDDQEQLLTLEAADFHTDLLNRWPQPETRITFNQINDIFFPTDRLPSGLRPPGHRSPFDPRRDRGRPDERNFRPDRGPQRRLNDRPRDGFPNQRPRESASDRSK